MKSIKEKAAEYRRVIKVIDERESLVDTQGSEMFEAGANYVLECIEESIKNAPVGYGLIYHIIEQLKK